MAIAADSAGVADAIEPSPSGASLRGLDAVNLFLAGALSGFGPYVAAFLAEQNWTQQDIGFVLTAAGFAGLLSQLPGGELLDAIRSKRIRGRAGRRYGCSRRADHCSLADFPAGIDRSGAPRDHRRISGAGDCCHQPWPGRPRRAWRTTRTQSALRLDGRGGCGWSHGPHRLFPVVSRDILRRRRAGAAAARRSRPHPAFRYPFRPRLVPPESPRAERTAESTAPELFEKPRPAHIRRLRVLVPDGQRVDAATRRRGARVQQGSFFLAHRLSVDHGPPGDRGDHGAVGRTPGEHVGPPAAAARRIRGVADPCAGVRLDHQSNQFSSPLRYSTASAERCWGCSRR